MHSTQISSAEPVRSGSHTRDPDRLDIVGTTALTLALAALAELPDQEQTAADRTDAGSRPPGGPPPGTATGAVADLGLLDLRRISHDIHHELGTIMMLASLLSSATDVGCASKDRARQILGELRWLDELQRAYEEMVVDLAEPVEPGKAARIRLDALADEVIAAMRLSTRTRITFHATETWAHADRLACWRALRNVMGNAIRAAGASGHVDVRVASADAWAVVQIDDDGPGLGQVAPGLASLGLGIVQDLAAAHGGQLEIRRGVLGGCCVRLSLPTSDTPDGGPCN